MNMYQAVRDAAPKIANLDESAGESAREAGHGIRDMASQAGRAVNDNVDRLTRGVHTSWQRSRDAARAGEETIENYIRRWPVTSVLMAVLAGCMLTYFFGRRR